ncbi:MAG TPA: prepilin-type N-terminal cleavage/methylation domain-containing protein [Armatimonadota bacterium]
MNRRPKHIEGFTLIELLIVIAVVAILCSIGVPGLLAARKAGNEGVAIPTLKSMVAAEETYKNRNLGGTNCYANLAQLVSASHLSFPEDNHDGSFTASQYRYSTVECTASGYALKAEPLSASAGGRCFAVTEDGYIREKAASVLTESTGAQLRGLSIVAR